MYTTIQEQAYDRSDWQRPRTTRRYLHPPKSERMFTLWAEGKIIFGEEDDGSDVIDKKQGHEYYSDLECCGIWMLHGADREVFDIKKVENLITPDGVPVHGIRHRIGMIEVTEESFCNTARKSTCFIKVSVHNMDSVISKAQISFLLRTGKEKQLLFGRSDQYVDYDPDVNVWKKDHPATWRAESGVFTDGVRVLTLRAKTAPEWDAEEGALDFAFSLAPGECKEIFFTLNCGEAITGDYDMQKEIVNRFWHREFARMTKLPKEFSENEETYRMLRHMLAQLLQLFTYPVGKSYLLWRQGGQQRIVWPGEVHVCFEALAKMGDFSDYLEPVLDTYFNVMQAADGEVVNIGIYWMSVTGCALYSYAKYCIDGGEAGRKCYDTYREQVYKAFKWICKTRRSTIGDESVAQGLFPAKKANDWHVVLQAWQLTDSFNIMGIKALAETAEAFGDPRACEFWEEHKDYVATMRKYAKPFIEKSKDSDELYIPLIPLGDDRKLVEDLYPMLTHGEFIGSGAVEKEEDIRKIYRWLQRTGRCDGGLYGRMQMPKRTVWYVSAPDYRWFRVWKALGEREKMEEILQEQFRFAMTEEYYMIERYDENQPYFVPWSPNASAMGRTILMMYDLI